MNENLAIDSFVYAQIVCELIAVLPRQVPLNCQGIQYKACIILQYMYVVK